MQTENGAYVFYAGAERKDNLLSTKLSIYDTFVIASIIILPASEPILYAIFKFPQPEKWTLAFPAK